MYLLDSDTLIEVLRGNRNAAAAFSAHLATTTLSASAITSAELYHGAARSSDPARRAADVSSLFMRVAVIPIDEHIAERYGQVKAALQHAGQVIADFDILIGATALVHGLTLVTHNTRDFRRIPNLVLNDWL
jgi:tRNA(fMet)-specific endonuclease VapC